MSPLPPADCDSPSAGDSFRYIPGQDFYGADSFIYRASNGSVESLDAVVTITVTSVLDARIDIKPGSRPNPINLRAKGVLSVAILSTHVGAGEVENFAARTVRPKSIRFGDPRFAARVRPLRALLVDVDRDGDLDVVIQFSLAEIRRKRALRTQSPAAILTGLAFTRNGLVPLAGEASTWGVVRPRDCLAWWSSTRAGRRCDT